jgi:opacity protein-like surface antigen
MKNTLVLTLALCCLFISMEAQVRDLPGYIVRNSGDTVHGFLKEQGLDESARQISYKSAESDNDYQIFTPSDVKAFQYDGGDLYRSITFSDTRRDEPVTLTYYGKLLVTGEYDLYNFTEDEVLFFLVRRDNTFYLMFDDDLRSIPGIKGNFRNELNFFTSSCDAVRQTVDNVAYSTVTMIQFFQKLDACLNPGKSVTSFYHHQKVKIQTGLFVYVGGISFGNYAQLTAEARLRVTLNQMMPGVSFNLGYRYAEVMKKHFQNPYYLVAPNYNHETWQIKSIPLTVQYNFTRGVVQPYAFGGVSLSSENIITDNPELYLGTYNPYFNSYALAFLFGAGVEVRLIHFLWARVEWRYETMAQYPTVGLAVTLP